MQADRSTLLGCRRRHPRHCRHAAVFEPGMSTALSSSARLLRTVQTYCKCPDGPFSVAACRFTFRPSEFTS